MIKAVIIDDEKLARNILKAYLRNTDVEVVAECPNGFEGIKAINEYRPDLIFLDIQMPKLNGFEMLELIENPPVVIFSTAFDQYAIKAFELNAADYLLKPYNEKRFKTALEKALTKIEKPDNQAEKVVNTHRDQLEELERIVIRSGTNILIIPVGDIDFFEAQDDYVAIHTGGKKYLKQITLKWLEDVLPADRFVRVHRSFIVAVGAIDKLEAYSKDAYIAKLKSGETVSVSRSGYGKLKETLNF